MPPTIPPDRYAVGSATLRRSLTDARRRNLAPPPKLTLSEWADRYAVLSKETSAQTGRYHAYGYQRGVMDAITDPRIDQVTVKKSARTGYTKILDNAVGYFLHQDPCPILLVQPRNEDAEDYSKTEISPMLRDTPVLTAICPEVKAKDTAQTILTKSFLNGSSLRMVGANSPNPFRRITVRIVLLDEVDGYPVGGAGADGDQVALAYARAETFWNRKLVIGSTPTKPVISRVCKEFEASDKREYRVPCPQCGHKQALRWGGKECDYGIKWSRNEKGEGLPETAYYLCSSGNGCIIDWSSLPEMDAAGEWVATAPFNGNAGFYMWSGMNLTPNAAWPKLVAQWLKCKADPLQRQTFYNLVLGEPYEDRGEGAMSEMSLVARGETWAAEVPDGVAILTAGVDTHESRFECEVVGWGANEESWSLDYEVIEGDPDDPDTIKRLDAYLQKTWHRADGRPFAIKHACVDSGGRRTQAVYDFSKARLGRRIVAVKGESARGGARSPVWPTKRPSSRNKASFRPVIIGVNAAKDVVRARLAIQPNGGEAPNPGYCHFPSSRDVNYYAQLLAENSITKTINGSRVRVWIPAAGRANEALDCRVYAYASLCGLQYAGFKLNVEAARVAESLEPPAAPPPPPAPVPQDITAPAMASADRPVQAPAPLPAAPEVVPTTPGRAPYVVKNRHAQQAEADRMKALVKRIA